jgi:hypothetical protein
MYSKKEERDFSSVREAFRRKYSQDGDRLEKDLEQLLRMREQQCFGAAYRILSESDSLLPEQKSELHSRLTKAKI